MSNLNNVEMNNNEMRTFVCADCGEVINLSESDANKVLIEGTTDEIVICDSCLNFKEVYIYDEITNKYMKITTNRILISGLGYSCETSLADSNEYIKCTDCGNYIKRDMAVFIDEDNDDEMEEGYYCQNCASKSKNVIKSYHSMKNANNLKYFLVNGESKDTTSTFGIELEVESGDNVQLSEEQMAKRVRKIFSKNGMKGFCNYEHDSSLDDGFEIISNPFSVEFMLKNEDVLEKVLRELRANGYISHKGGHCGLHIHIGKQSLDGNEKDNFYIISEWFKEEMKKFSRRTIQSFNRWSRPSTKDYDKSELTVDKILSRRSWEDDNRYSMVNTCNRGTLEARFMRGTLKTNSFFAAIYGIANILEFAKSLDHRLTTDELRNLDFIDIIAYKYGKDKIERYLIERKMLVAEQEC